MVEEIMNIVVVGHVDHGKSTVIGHLLADTGTLPKGKLESIRESCKRNSKPFEYAFLLDALKNEQAQGITIDTARCFFHTDKRRYIIIDAPGHIEFLKNMVTGASRAEAALVVIDASHGVEENTRRHGYYLSMLGIKQVAVLVNKMDLVNHDQAVFDRIVGEYTAFLQEIGLEAAAFIPVSALEGDNIAHPAADTMPWYQGNTVLAQLDAFENVKPPLELPFRMPVQGVYKFTSDGDTRRIVAGTVETGTLSVGDEVVFYPSGKRTRVKCFETFHAPVPNQVGAEMAIGFTMTEEIYIRRGEVVCRTDEMPAKVGVRLRANLFWLGNTPLQEGRSYHFKCGTQKIGMTCEQVVRVVNASDLDQTQRSYVEKHEVAECIFDLDTPAVFDTADTVASQGRFVIVDGYEQAGGGIILERLDSEEYDRRNIRWSHGTITRPEREKATGCKGLVVWMTGLSGAGKTTIAQNVERALLADGIPTYLLDGDHLRRGLNADLGFSDEDRMENQRRVAEVAALFRDAGMVTLVSTISPYQSCRDLAREKADGAFLEVYVKADFETCMHRDPKQLYRKATSGGIANFTGMGSRYEVPEHPDLVLDTQRLSEEEATTVLLERIGETLRKN